MPQRAGFWIRVLATLLDGIAMAFIAGFVGFSIFVLESRTSYGVAPGGFAAIVYAIMMLYSASELFAAATPGKLLLRLRISNVDCTPADFWRLFLRWSTKWLWLILGFLFVLSEWPPLYWLSGFLSFVVFIGCFYAANDDRLTWHDQWAQTAVCHPPRSSRSLDAIVPPPPLPPPAQPPGNA